MPVDPTDETIREAWELHRGDNCPSCGLTPFDTCKSVYVGGCEGFRRTRDALHERDLLRNMMTDVIRGRCEVCSWPYGPDPADCRPGDCSYRPHPSSDEHARIAPRRAVVGKLWERMPRGARRYAGRLTVAEPLRRAGQALSNAAFNLAQREHLTADERRSLDESRRAWDAAVGALRAKEVDHG